jgi:hypothetical protein
MFCAPELVFNNTGGVESRFYVLRARSYFRQYRGCRVPVSYFALPDSFSAVPRALGSVFMFCAPEIIFVGTKGVGSRLKVLRSWTRFRRYRGRRVPFSCFARPESFSAVPRASGPVFLFCAPGLIFSGAVFMFCAPWHVFGAVEGVGSRFRVLRSRTRFGRYRGCRFPFSNFALPNSFSPVRRATGTVFLFFAPEIIIDSTGGVGSRFHVLRARTHYRQNRGR